MPRLLVTGVTGCLGRAVARAARAGGWAVRGLSRGVPREPLDLEYEQVLGDVAEPGVVARAVSGCEAVVHLAGWVHRIPRGAAEEGALRRSIVDGTRLVAEAVAASRGRLVMSSSAAVYGSRLAPGSLDEATPPAPDTPYGRAKLEAEVHARKVVSDACILRCTLVYGPNDRGNFLSLIRAVDQVRALVAGRGENGKALVFVDNLADRVVAALSRPPSDVAGEWNVADAPAPTQLEIARTIARHLRRPVPPRVPLGLLLPALGIMDELGTWMGRDLRLADQAGKLSSWTAFSGRALDKRLGYEARVPFDEGVRRTVAWYRGSGR